MIRQMVKKFGVMYNYFAVSDPSGIIPDGFHLSTDLGGLRIFDGSYSNVDRSIYYWTSTEESVLTQFYYGIQTENDQVDRNYGFVNYGMYLRCVKNK
jgi:hypothetical protein